MKKKLRILSAVLVAALLLPIFTTARDKDVEPEEISVIKAEDIGIKEIENEPKEVDSTDEIISEGEDYHEDIIHKKEYVKQEEVEEEVVPEPDEEDVVIPDCPEGMSEGYIAGTFFEPNHFGDCELHEYCYICPECTIEEEVGYDEEINPNGGYYLSRCCTMCGHGTCEPITESEALGE